MNFKEFDAYQDYCRRFYPTPETVLRGFTDSDPDREACYTVGLKMHALHGLASEVGELHGLHQKDYQGHDFDVLDVLHAKKELGDVLWFVAEYAACMGWKLSDVAETNVAKLDARYPHGFDAEHSLHRAEGDI